MSRGHHEPPDVAEHRRLASPGRRKPESFEARAPATQGARATPDRRPAPANTGHRVLVEFLLTVGSMQNSPAKGRAARSTNKRPARRGLAAQRQASAKAPEVARSRRRDGSVLTSAFAFWLLPAAHQRNGGHPESLGCWVSALPTLDGWVVPRWTCMWRRSWPSTRRAAVGRRDHRRARDPWAGA